MTVLEFMDELKGDKVLQDKVLTLPNVKIITGAETKLVNGNGSKVTGLEFKHRSSGFEEKIDRITSYNVCYTKLLRHFH